MSFALQKTIFLFYIIIIIYLFTVGKNVLYRFRQS